MWRVLRFIRGMRSGSAGSKYCERGACQKWQASFALMTIGKMRSRGVCKINPLTIKGGTVMILISFATFFWHFPYFYTKPYNLISNYHCVYFCLLFYSRQYIYNHDMKSLYKRYLRRF